MPNASAPIRTIHMARTQWRRLVTALEKRSASPSIERRGLRVTYLHDACEAEIVTGRHQRVRYAVVPRNLSRWGFAFIHGQYVHPEARCVIDLVDRQEHRRPTPGRVLRCNHLKGILHEVTVLFDQPLDLERFVELDAEQAARLARERDQRALPDASLAVLGGDEGARQRLARDLERVSARVVAHPAAADLFASIEAESFDFVVIIHDERCDPNLVGMLRSFGYPGRILIAGRPEGLEARGAEGSADDPAGASPGIGGAIWREDSDGGVFVLDGEPTPEAVVGRLQELLAGGPAKPEDDARPLFDAVRSAIRHSMEAILAARQARDARRLAALCDTLAASAAAVGLGAIAEAARPLAARRGEDADGENAGDQLLADDGWVADVDALLDAIADLESGPGVTAEAA